MLKLTSPLTGWCASIEEVPDPVFAGCMLGDGLAIDPTGDTLHAPCDGEVISIAVGKHAIAIRSPAGIELLMHVGIDTVNCGGAGFEPLVRAGQHVTRGQALLRFDLEALAANAKSVITPIMVTNTDRFEIVHRHVDRLIEVGDTLLEMREHAAQLPNVRSAAGNEVSERLTIVNEHGLHARPAAAVANGAKKLAAQVRIEAHGRSANATSAMAIMALGVKRGDQITLIASGEEAAGAIRILKQTIAELEDAAADTTSRSARARHEPSRNRARATAHGQLLGVIASRGFAVGRVVTLRHAELQVEEQGNGIGLESREFDRARAHLRAELAQLAARSTGMAAGVMAAHLAFLDDPELIVPSKSAIAEGKSAAFAWRQSIRRCAAKLESLNDERMQERISDLLDLETQLLQQLSGAASERISLSETSVIVAADLKPSELVSMDASRLAAIVLARGGPTSHVALLAAAMGVPALVALGEEVLSIADGSWVIVDAEEGALSTLPDQAELAAAQRAIKLREQHQQGERAAANLDCYTADGTRIEVFANLASIGEAKVAVGNGAEGCGLLRTEFLFLDRIAPPDEVEQLQQYQEIAGALAGRPLVIRTLDIGGDKPIAYLPLPVEENPALGLRGVRTSLWQPDLLRAQLRAILRVRPAGQCRILLPMITDSGELKAIRTMIAEAQSDLGTSDTLQIGVMIETPASALLADRLLRDVDFLSIGTNDLTQYTLAMDRSHSELAHRIDALHPAVLALIARAAAAGNEANKLVAVCGGLASEAAAVPILLGLGVRELSVVATLVPRIKAIVRGLRLDACRALAQRALDQSMAEDVRALANEFARAQSTVTS
jgi:phosphocarrier protein FPr/phosphocarrier protein